jgi:hypothetical protein
MREAAAALAHRSTPAGFYVWLLIRAAIYIAILAALLARTTRNRKIVSAYCAAHVAALLSGALIDFAVWKLVLRSQATVGFLEGIYAAPIFIFTGISLWICHWETALALADVLMPIGAIVLWGCAVIWGGQNMEGIDILGAWFVSAGVGAVDLVSLYGPPAATRRKYVTRALGDAATVALVYWLLPRT